MTRLTVNDVILQRAQPSMTQRILLKTRRYRLDVSGAGGQGGFHPVAALRLQLRQQVGLARTLRMAAAEPDLGPPHKRKHTTKINPTADWRPPPPPPPSDREQDDPPLRRDFFLERFPSADRLKKKITRTELTTYLKRRVRTGSIIFRSVCVCVCLCLCASVWARPKVRLQFRYRLPAPPHSFLTCLPSPLLCDRKNNKPGVYTSRHRSRFCNDPSWVQDTVDSVEGTLCKINPNENVTWC